MKRLTIKLAAVAFSCALAGTVLAANPPGTGQPGVECEDVRPGNAVSAPGSAFNPDGTAGGVYANPDSKGGLASGNTHVVSQYDVACFQQTIKAMLGLGGGN